MRPRKTILCVEDNEQILSVRKFLLETRGYRVVAVMTAAEAIGELERALPGSIDLLLSDLILPQMDGNELVKRAKQMHPFLPALLVSGTVTSFERATAADAFLPKGACTPVEMLDRIRYWWRGNAGRRSSRKVLLGLKLRLLWPRLRRGRSGVATGA